jgi:DNA-binding NtrC family response regulator
MGVEGHRDRGDVGAGREREMRRPSATLLFRRVLLVEDEGRLRDMLTRAVGEMGFEGEAVGSGEAALRVLGQRAFDTVILDLNLPGLSGIELLATIRSRWPDVQAIILTGFGDLDTAKRAIHLDVVDFLTKPCSLAELEVALGRAAGKRLRARENGSRVPPRGMDDEEAGMSLEELERKHILASLQRHDGNRAATAAELGISLRKLYYRLGEYQRMGLMPGT